MSSDSSPLRREKTEIEATELLAPCCLPAFLVFNSLLPLSYVVFK